MNEQTTERMSLETIHNTLEDYRCGQNDRFTTRAIYKAMLWELYQVVESELQELEVIE